MSKVLQYHGQNLSYSIVQIPDQAKLVLDKKHYNFTFQQISEGRLIISSNGRNYQARAVRSKDKIWIWLSGKKFEFLIPSADHTFHGSDHVSKDVILTPMPGNLLKLTVKVGDKVEEGQTLAVVEAMKMEHNLRAPRAGVVKSVHGKVGEILEGEFCIVALEPLS